MTSEWVHLDGRLVPADQARVETVTPGFLYGLGVFETFRATNGRVLGLDRHHARARTGAGVLDLSLPLTLDGLRSAVTELTSRCGLADGRVRWTVADRGNGRPPVSLLTARPLDDYPSIYVEGVAAVFASTVRNERSPLSRLKTLNYLDNLLSRRQADAAGAYEALLLNTGGAVAEGSATNVFVVSGTRLLTPRVEDGALAGVTRGVVLELARGAGLSPSEIRLTPDDLFAADEALLTNAVAGVLPLVSLDARPVGTGVPGAATTRLRALYEELRREAVAG